MGCLAWLLLLIQYASLGQGFDSWLVPFCGVCMFLCFNFLVFSVYSSVLPQSKNIHVSCKVAPLV